MERHQKADIVHLEQLDPSPEIVFGNLQNQGEKIVYMELLDPPSPEMNFDVKPLGPSLKMDDCDLTLPIEFGRETSSHSDNSAKRPKPPNPDLLWRDSLLVKKEWEGDNGKVYPVMSRKSDLESLLFQINFEKDMEINSKSKHLNGNEDSPMSVESNLKWAFKFAEEIKEQIEIFSRSTRKRSESHFSINHVSPSFKRIGLTLEPTDNVKVESGSQSVYANCEDNIRPSSVHKLKLTYCKKCDMIFNTKKGLNNHILSVHKKSELFKCSSCNYVFSENETLSKHTLSVHKSFNQHKCPICDLAFDTGESLSIHINTVHKQLKTFKCTYCDYSSSYSSNLTVHMKSVHMKIKSYKCFKCHYSCSQKVNLDSHIMSVHEKRKLFKCLECNYSFSRKNSLFRHITSVHEKLKPFKCLECDYSASLKFNLDCHMKSVHEKRKPFKCLECNNSFSRKNSLFRHITSVHEKLKP